VKLPFSKLRDRSLTWLGAVRLRAFVLIIGLPLAVMGVASLGPAWLALPLVGVTVAAITMTLGRVTSKLGDHVCWTCGHDLANEPQGTHGVACPACGSLNQHNPLWRNEVIASAAEDPSGDVGADENEQARPIERA
jgi:predicted RNA-binding Zn-ribbon protein involved in translation (DUF1610 family)